MTSPTRFEIAAAAVAFLLSGIAASAQTGPPPPSGQAVSYDQFKAQQLQQLQRVQARLSQQLAAADLPADQRQRLEHRQAQLAKFTTMPPDRQEALLHRRFDRIDANRDGAIDPGELQAFRQHHRDRTETRQNASGPGGSKDDFWPSQSQN